MSQRVLVVDDASFMRFVIRDILTKLGHEVVGEAADGVEACARYDELEPDLVTLDLVMPKKSGLEALRDIRAKHPQAKIIVVSALEQRETLMEAFRLGAADYLVKPFSKDRVAQAIERMAMVA
jgi:two-component system chemotaxis response regulator CheY